MNLERIKKAIEYFFDKDKRFLVLAKLHGYYPNMSDEEYVSRLWRAKFGTELNLKNPVTFNEKLQWLKLYDRRPEYTTMVDKYAVKKYIAEKIGGEYIIPTLGVWNSFDDIDFDSLPNQFVLKCTHDSGGLVICRDKTSFDRKSARKKINASLKRDYYLGTREWPYKDVPRRIIAEKYMEDKATKELRDYKFFAFDGVVKSLFIATDRFNKNEETKFDFFDAEFRHLEICNGHPNASVPPAKPENFERMKELVSVLTKNIPCLRTDFYEIDGKIYFGELTFFHWSGLVPFEPESWDKTFGEWIKLPENAGGGYVCIDNSYVLWLHKAVPAPKSLTDYKVMCFSGRPAFIQVHKGRFSKHTQDFYTPQWEKTDIYQPNMPNSAGLTERPALLEDMLRFSATLAAGIPQLRCDWYICNGRLYFSELTFFDGSGMTDFCPDNWNVEFGDRIELPVHGGAAQ